MGAHEHQIDVVVGRFYAAFDNRDRRMPALDDLESLFAAAATITRVTRGTSETWTVPEFIAPRAAILGNGSLTDFHEWETASGTIVMGRMASRRSHYAKAGARGGITFEGGGWKLIHLHRAADTWLISSILWEDEETEATVQHHQLEK